MVAGNNVFFDEIFDDFSLLGFGKPKDLIFNVGNTKDMYPAFWSKIENGYKATCRTVGIDSDDVKVELCNNYISVSGKSTYEGENYNVSYKIPISDDVVSNIESLKYRTLNGLTYIYLEVSKHDKKEIKAIKI